MNQVDNRIESIVDNLFRVEYGKVVGYLTKKFGSRYFELVEDSVQESLFMAMKTWPHRSVPDNPSAWIFRAANNKMIDRLRKVSKLEYVSEPNLGSITEERSHFYEIDDQLKDEQLMMLFACCHPD